MTNHNDDIEILDLTDLLDEDDEVANDIRRQEETENRSPSSHEDGEEEDLSEDDMTISDETLSPEETAAEAPGERREAPRRPMSGNPKAAMPDAVERKTGKAPGSRRNSSSRQAAAGNTDPAPQTSPLPAAKGNRKPAPVRRPLTRREEKDSQDRRSININLILLLVIVAALVIAVVRFVIWNRGVDVNFDPDQVTAKYDIEVNDNMVMLPESKLEGHTDDGKTTILALGNAPFADDTSATGLASQIAQYGDCDVINASFPQSQVTCLNKQYSTETLRDMDDIFNLFYVTYYMTIGDYSALETVAQNAHPDNEQYIKAVEALKNTDFNNVDIIAIMYDAADYENKSPIVNMGYTDELTTYVGSLQNSFKLIQEKYPWIRIVFMSPTYMLHQAEDGQTENGRKTDLGNGTLIQYWQWAFDTCGSYSVSFLDNYYGSVNEHNYEDYLTDNVHLNAAGRTRIADHFIYKVIKQIYEEYDVSKLQVITDQ